jgi:hypothetical protein
MTWLFGEPTLDEAISDPVVIAMMRRDGVDPARLRLLLETVGARLAAKRVRIGPPEDARDGEVVSWRRVASVRRFTA